jgi:hypothetical protein
MKTRRYFFSASFSTTTKSSSSSSTSSFFTSTQPSLALDAQGGFVLARHTHSWSSCAQEERPLRMVGKDLMAAAAAAEEKEELVVVVVLAM